MKKYFVLAACVGVALASCVNDEKLDVYEAKKEQQKVTFNSPVMGANSRVVLGEMTSPYSINETFNVFAVQHEGDYVNWDTHFTNEGGLFMDNLLVRYLPPAAAGEKGTWTSDDDYYWPVNKKVTFGAYSPTKVKEDVGEGKITYSSKGLKIEDFVVPEVSHQYDLMFSDLARSKHSSSGSSSADYDGVDINFKHALSSIRFKAKTASTLSAWIKEIKIISAHNKGTFEQNLNPSSSTGIHHTYGEPAWTRTSEVVDYMVYEEEEEDAQAITTALEPIGESLLLMPQPFSKDGTVVNLDAKISICYKVGSNPYETVEVDIHDLSDDWVMARRYTYTIVIGGNGTIQKITFAPSVEGWTDTGGTINI